MHPADAAARGIADGDAVEVFNGRGEFDGCGRRWATSVAAGVVAARLNWNKLAGTNGAGNVNVLTSETADGYRGGATFYSALVEVRKQTIGVHADEQV